MADAWIINASPIILYARIDRLDLFEQLSLKVIVPAKVIEEVRHGVSKDSSASKAVAWAAQYQQPDVSIPGSVERWDLGPGESQVISFCLQGAGWAVLDDQMARRCVSAHGLLMIGSLGVILRAKKHGLVDAARPWVNKLIDQGMYVTDELVKQSLTAIGEIK
jgi:predicted nucleic acid-binding protein